MKIFMDLATPESPVYKAIKQVFTTIGELEFVATVQEADAIIADEPEKAEVYIQRTDKRVAQVLWWKQKRSTMPESDRFKVFDALPQRDSTLLGLVEAISFLKGSEGK